MTMETRIRDLITAVGTDYKTFRTWMFGSAAGTLAGLTTTDKTSLVHAINEVKASATGSPPDASTTVKGVGETSTDGEALAMSATDKFVTPSNLGAITNVNNGLAKLDASGKVASAQLPAFVDDVVEAANFAALPGTGEAGKIYTTLDNNKAFRWGGSAYVEISASPGTTDAVTEGSVNLYFTNGRADTRITALVGDTDADLVAAYDAAKA